MCAWLSMCESEYMCESVFVIRARPNIPNIRLYWKYFQLKFDFRIHFSIIRNSIEFRIPNIHTVLSLWYSRSAKKELQDSFCPNFLAQFILKLCEI